MGGGGRAEGGRIQSYPLTGHGDPQSCEMSRLPHFLYSQLTDGSEVLSLTHQQPLPRRLLVLIPVRGPVDPMAIVQLEGLGQMKKQPGNWTHDLLARSIVLQPTMLPYAPDLRFHEINFKLKHKNWITYSVSARCIQHIQPPHKLQKSYKPMTRLNCFELNTIIISFKNTSSWIKLSTYSLCTRWLRRSGVTDWCHSFDPWTGVAVTWPGCRPPGSCRLVNRLSMPN
jgi:hypothetical protein